MHRCDICGCAGWVGSSSAPAQWLQVDRVRDGERDQVAIHVECWLVRGADDYVGRRSA